MLAVIEKVLLLQELDFFQFAFTEHLSQIGSICKEIKVKAGTVLFREGDPCRLFHILISGQVALEAAGQTRMEIEHGPLDFWSFFSELPSHYTARAISESLILTVRFEDMVDLLTAEPEFCWAITRQLAQYGRQEGLGPNQSRGPSEGGSHENHSSKHW